MTRIAPRGGVPAAHGGNHPESASIDPICVTSFEIQAHFVKKERSDAVSVPFSRSMGVLRKK
ncbi:hypothetical protein [Bifidobacterium sp. SO4]|uniref:hypothetical protein n=1 Tax=Bifidobacterium sp. SO4 TaxID=2809030 RepID=UPI001BDCB905|nr:hypothetical protein [Bifidobacterium sp. SO4]MBT1170760.1 hypothetical protein [Bifidobacterium sp. SO4]